MNIDYNALKTMSADKLTQRITIQHPTFVDDGEGHQATTYGDNADDKTIWASVRAYAAIGARLGLGESAVKVAVHRLRTRFADLTRAEIAETLMDPTPAEIDAELGTLIAALRGHAGGTAI